MIVMPRKRVQFCAIFVALSGVVSFPSAAATKIQSGSMSCASKPRAEVIAKVNSDFAGMDAGRDGTVNRAELRASIAAKNANVPANVIDSLTDMSFTQFDQDKNGLITRAEALRLALRQCAKH